MITLTEDQLSAAMEAIRQKLTDPLNNRGTPETHLLTGSKRTIVSLMEATFLASVKAAQKESEAGHVLVAVELQNSEVAYQLAQFVKRAHFNTCLRLTDGGDDEKQAYCMIDGLTAVQRGLRAVGYAPR